MRYFLKLSYDGSSWHGWQRQPNATSVQQTLEQALSTLMRVKTDVTGAGRTDTGVNARVMFAHFDTQSPIVDTHRMITSLNRLCGHSICVSDILPVKDDAHARFDALRRCYKYFLINDPSPFASHFARHLTYHLDVDMMNQAAAILLQTDDFTSFAKLHSDAMTNICNVTRAEWTPCQYATGESGLVFTIEADRFLRNMVRAVVGTLVDVGRKRISVQGFRDIIAARNRCAAGTSMPPHPLFLWDIIYPATIFKPHP